MKSAILVAGLVALSAVSGQQLPTDNTNNQSDINDFDYMRSIFYSSYNGFVRGFYREHSHNVISTECLGSWVS